MTALRFVRPMPRLLHLVADELADLARLGSSLEQLVGRLSADCILADAQALTDAQAADLLVQRLNGVATYVRALAGACADETAVDVLAAVADLTLAEQAGRLGDLCPPTAVNQAQGDLMLFSE